MLAVYRLYMSMGPPWHYSILTSFLIDTESLQVLYVYGSPMALQYPDVFSNRRRPCIGYIIVSMGHTHLAPTHAFHILRMAWQRTNTPAKQEWLIFLTRPIYDRGLEWAETKKHSTDYVLMTEHIILKLTIWIEVMTHKVLQTTSVISQN